MKKHLAFVLFFLMSTSRLAFAQNEAIANDYFEIKFCECNQIEDVPYKICDICIVSFDIQMNCIKTHIYMVGQNQHWFPEMQSFHGKIEFINDSTVAYTSNNLINAIDDLSKTLMQCLFFPDPMSSLKEDLVIRSSSIRMGETMILYQLNDLGLKRSELRDIKKILKLCGLQMKNNRIQYPTNTP